MRKLLLLFALSIFCFTANAQDTLFLKDNTKVVAKVLEINDLEIKYKAFSNIDGPLYIKKKSEVVKVKYKTGSEDVFQTESKSSSNVNYASTPAPVQTYVKEEQSMSKQDYADMFRQGKSDAKIYYKGYKGAGTGTFLTTLILGPIVGLVPAIATSVSTPNEDHLTFPNVALTKNPDYVTGYTQEAKKKKSRKVWGNYGIATGIIVVLVGVAAGNAR
jgi:hypothetical protein